MNMANLNLNKVILGGRLTADPELKQTPSGLSVCQISIAINRKKQKDQTEQQADFINCTAWRSTAEFISKYFRKGSSICVTGSIQTKSWTDQQNNKRYATEVVIDEAMFVDSKNESSTTQTTEQPTFTPDTNAFDNADFEVMSSGEDLPF
jgi:single-strand DNA-binding protein